MAHHDPVTTQLCALYQRCVAPSRHRQITQRWARHPALHGRDLDQLVAVLHDPADHDHNPVAAALLRAHRDGDEDASTLLLTALRPIVVALDGRAARPQRHADLWAAVGKLLATTSPAEVAASPSPFIQVLIGRLRRDAGRAHRTGHRRSALIVPLTEDLRTSTGTDVEGVAVARWELTALARQLRDGHIEAAAWNQLVVHRVQGRAHTCSTTRSQVQRTGRRLAVLVGHSAA